MTLLSKKAESFILNCWHHGFQPSALEELLTENCLHKTIVGKRVGRNALVSILQDWIKAFPDFCVKIKSLKQLGNSMQCNLEFSGTFLDTYVSRHTDLGSVVSVSNFYKSITTCEPNGKSYVQPAKFYLTFLKGKISYAYLDEAPENISQQIDLTPPIVENSYFSLAGCISPDLGQRESECLALALCGFSAKFSAEILRISPRTVETHLYKAYQKLGCYGKQHCLEKLYEKGKLHLCWEFTQELLTTVH